MRMFEPFGLRGRKERLNEAPKLLAPHTTAARPSDAAAALIADGSVSAAEWAEIAAEKAGLPRFAIDDFAAERAAAMGPTEAFQRAREVAVFETERGVAFVRAYPWDETTLPRIPLALGDENRAAALPRPIVS